MVRRIWKESSCKYHRYFQVPSRTCKITKLIKLLFIDMKCYFRFNRYFNMYIEYTWVGGKCMSTRHRPKTIYSNCIVLSMAKFLPNLGSYNQTPLHRFFLPFVHISPKPCCKSIIPSIFTIARPCCVICYAWKLWITIHIWKCEIINSIVRLQQTSVCEKCILWKIYPQI